MSLAACSRVSPFYVRPDEDGSKMSNFMNDQHDKDHQKSKNILEKSWDYHWEIGGDGKKKHGFEIYPVRVIFWGGVGGAGKALSSN